MNHRIFLLCLLLIGLSNAAMAQKTFNDRKRPTSSNPAEKPALPHEVVEYKGNRTDYTRNFLCKTTNGDLFTAKINPGSALQYLWVEVTPTGNYTGNNKSVTESAVNPLTDIKARCYSYVSALGKTLQASELVNWNPVKFETDNYGMFHAKYQLSFDQFEIYGAEVYVHGHQNNIASMQGLFLFPDKNFNTHYTLSQNEALAIVAKTHGISDVKDSLKVTEGYYLKGHEEKLLIYYGKNTTSLPRMCWYIELHRDLLHRDFVFVDANTGEILNTIDATCEANGPKTTTVNDYLGKPTLINTYEYSGAFYMLDASRSMFSSSQSTLPNSPVGAIWTLDAKNTSASGSLYQISTTNNSTWNNIAVSAHNNAQMCYSYYKNTHSRNSIDAAGGNIISVINVTEEDGSGLDNAYWNGSFMAYGNGKNVFKPLAAALDVGGHEMTHGVVEKTANLEYQGQSGAMNESMADIFGAMIDRDDWRMGEDITKTAYFPSGALRDLSDPHNGVSSGQNGYQPRTMSEFYTGSSDNGGVHTNSGIPNWAYYKIATSITKEKAELIYYRALSFYLTKTSQFLDLRFAVIKAATDIHGASSAEVAAIKAAFDAVQIYDPNPSGSGGGGSGGGSGGTYDLPANTGTEKVLSYDTDNSTAATLYISSTVPNNFSVLSSTNFNRKPSVTDNGIKVYFVDENGYLKGLASDQSYAENTLSNQSIWANAAISKDGSKLAVITNTSDTSVWVYNFATTTWKKYKLYNPTYSGVNSTGVYSVDAIEWDAAGENIIYDAANKTTLSSGGTLDYWDIGIIKVWDNRSDNWGDGKVQKLFNQLPEDISIGNPAFSKNSPYIVAFDYIDAANNINAAMGYNISSNKSNLIIISSKLTNPSFSRLDNKLLYDDIESSSEVIKLIDLNSDKISPVSGSDVSFITDGKWGLWLTYGSRRLKNNAKDILTFSFPGLNPPVEGVISGSTITLSVPANTDVTALIPTFTNSPASFVAVGGNSQTSGSSAQNFTTSKIYRVTAQDNSTKDYTVVVNKQNATNSVNKTASSPATLSPVPAGNHLVLNKPVLNAELFDLSGKNVTLTYKTTGEKTAFDLSAVPQGIYFLKIQLTEGMQTLKVVKE